LRVIVEEVGHTVTPAQREAATEWFERWLKIRFNCTWLERWTTDTLAE